MCCSGTARKGMVCMAREWALRGMSEEELRPDPKPEPPKTPKGKIENYWYHYKWHTIAAVAIVAVLSVLIGQMVSRDNPDYSLVLVTKSYVPEPAVEKIETTFGSYGRDIDEDGKIEVQIDTISLSNDTQIGYANQQKLIAHLSAGDIMFYIFDKESYESNIKAQQTGNYRFFAPIDSKAEGTDANNHFWNWKGSELQKHKEFTGMPEDLYFGVRGVSGTSDNQKSKKMHQENLELLEAFLNKKPLTSGSTTTAAATTAKAAQ